MAPPPATQSGLPWPQLAPGALRLPKILRARRLALLAFAVFAYLVLSQRPRAQWRPPSSGATATSGDLAAVANDTLGFREVFVINRASRSDRRDSLSLAAALTGIRLSYSDGVDGSQVRERVLPADSEGKRIRKGNIGSWRAHLNVLRTVVEEGLETALILEDDIDWDVRLKAQLQTFSLASRAFLQPLDGHPHGHTLSALSREGGDTVAAAAVPLSRISQTPHRPWGSPYGNGWDVLWLGHCGTELPGRNQEGGASDAHRDTDAPPPQTQPGVITIQDDETVPAPRHLRPHPFADRLDRLATAHPPRTRVVHASRGTTCTLGYAVSQSGARKLLWRFGVDTFTTGFDLMLRDLCDGRYHADPGGDGENGVKGGGHEAEQWRARRRPVCLTVQPPLFSHFSSGRGDAGSDIQGVGGGYMQRSGSQYIRLSVKQNLGRLIEGAPFEELVDQWPDDKL
ncbi:hypothetical protein RB595_009318 [Gaeumannomyces hyphopodioides]